MHNLHYFVDYWFCEKNQILGVTENRKHILMSSELPDDIFYFIFYINKMKNNYFKFR